ncbi:DMT family transporter [Streptomyces sp. NPDC051940]|uniref:DMT family transporter n=1 Tax=Streptomyces sp. NPDC051940 TaxID=3155675 RepID=UPI00341AB5C9
MGALALLWGSCFLWIEVALDHGLTPVQITVARTVLGGAVLFALARRAGRPLPRGRGAWLRIAVAALLCNVVPFTLFGLGQRTVDSGVAGVLNATTPLFSLLLGLALGTERGLRPVRLLGLLLGFAGVSLIFAPWRQDGLASWGALMLLAAAASYAVAFAYMGRTLTGLDAGPVAVSAAQLLTAAALSAPALPLTGGLLPDRVDATALVAVAVLGVFGTGATFYLNYRLIETEGPTGAATVGYLLPVVSVTLGAVVLGEDAGPRVLAGMAVVLAGVGLTRRKPSYHPVNSPAAPDTAVDRVAP